MTLSYGGQDRSYVLAIPPGYDGRAAAPLVMQFHGFSGSKEAIEATTTLASTGAARGYVGVTPDSLGSPKEWNAFGSTQRADDFGFVHALLAELTDRLCIDSERIYAAGHSNGSAFAAFLVCREPYEFAAVAMVSATTPSSCPAGIRPATVAFAGTADPQVPYAGGQVGGSAIAIPPAVDTIAGYATRDACDAVPEPDEPAPSVERLRYVGCVDDADVVLYTIVGGGHSWPTDTSFRATDHILDFFDDHPRP